MMFRILRIRSVIDLNKRSQQISTHQALSVSYWNAIHPLCHG